MNTSSPRLHKALLNFQLDVKWIKDPRVPLSQRLRFLLNKYLSLLTYALSVGFLGRRLHYDNLWMPALMPDYVFEMERLEEHIDFSTIKTLFDIGANVGQLSFVLKSFYPDIKIYSFEPNSRIFPLLKKNADQFTQWFCFSFGLSEQTGRLPLYFVRGKSGQGSHFPENATAGLLSTEEPQKIEVPVKRLDATERQRHSLPSHIDFIKIDTEGAELSILNSLRDMTWNYLYVELSSRRDGAASTAQARAALGSAAEIKILFSTEPTGVSQTFQVLFQRQ